MLVARALATVAKKLLTDTTSITTTVFFFTCVTLHLEEWPE